MGRGWQSGIRSLVFLMASKPAARENSKISPLGTVLLRIASIVSGFDTERMAPAMAFRRLGDLWVMSTMDGEWWSVGGDWWRITVFQSFGIFFGLKDTVG